ncbi:intercellular adhesion molecule 1-like [Astyanax mexicanus]|uniref:Intercellular adhesion molecule 1-like n=1 Tax=Astyanax mexicanus TaxID=7994 RepID=A0A8T2LSB9_ASTMX|nr:intercellular adhesion molecule 1-like [Astyanax mexicanus]
MFGRSFCHELPRQGDEEADTSAGTNASSYLRLDPPRIVASFGSSISANCSTDVADYLLLDWESPLGFSKKTGPKTVTWIVESLTEWDMKPFCYISVNTDVPKQLPLSLTVYKTPDTVSISTVNHAGPTVEGRQYELKCDIQNVAPVGNVIVKWYKGDTLVGSTTFTESSKTPENLLATLQISPSRDDNGAQYRCEAELDLGPEGPQPPPAVMSDPLNITVHYVIKVEIKSEQTWKAATNSCDVHLLCRAPEDQTVSYRWRGFKEKDGAQLNFTLKPEEGDVTLNCTASGSTGNSSNTTTVKCTPKKIATDSPNSGASFSVLHLLSFLMAASPYLLSTIILGVKSYRARAKADDVNMVC